MTSPLRSDDGAAASDRDEAAFGEYFGEIALIYGCKRTATVQSLKYSTLAKLKKSDYQDILIEFPDLKK